MATNTQLLKRRRHAQHVVVDDGFQQQEQQQHLTLYYLDLPWAARAEPLRIALEIAGLDYEYKTLSAQEFLAIQTALPFGQLPVLEIRHSDYQYTLAQSNTILRYIGRLGKGQIYPKDPLLAGRCDEVMDAVQDVYSLLAPSNRERDHAVKVSMRQALAANGLPKWLHFLEAKLTANNTGYFVGSGLTVADLMASQLVTWLTAGLLEGIPPSIVAAFPRLCGLRALLLQHPAVRAYAQRVAAPVPSEAATLPSLLHQRSACAPAPLPTSPVRCHDSDAADLRDESSDGE
ncbi:glutathione S-transferase [Tribonema minus]|uniref:Glutathione S-transferase n=1 Tax=Tribonema minus TaxID=303371 RepID=A0A835ZCV6_9STRA|nr:glutathione S-transferase [Tribonema minus]